MGGIVLDLLLSGQNLALGSGRGQNKIFVVDMRMKRSYLREVSSFLSPGRRLERGLALPVKARWFWKESSPVPAKLATASKNKPSSDILVGGDIEELSDSTIREVSSSINNEHHPKTTTGKVP